MLPTHAFPDDLADDVIARWHAPAFGVFQRPPLPDRKQLAYILQVAYLASHETDEARPIHFTLCCTPPVAVVKRFQSDAKVEGWPLITPRTYDVQEVRRLAVTTHVDSAAIWVEWPVDPDGQPVIKGLLNLGESWAHARDAFAFHYDTLPDALTVRVEAPGNLAVYQAQFPLVSLVGGRLDVGRFLHESLHGINHLLEQGHRRFVRPLGSDVRIVPRHVAQEFTWTAYTNVILAIVNSIRAKGHGGALVLVANAGMEAPGRAGLLDAKYAVGAPADHLARLLESFLVHRQALAELQWRRGPEAEQNPSAADHADMRLAYADVRDANAALAEACGFIGNLTGADGAVVLHTDLTLAGFGAEIRLEHAPPAPVLEVVSASLVNARPLDSEQFGMRHRSAMRLCAADPDVAVFVVSQDGGVSLVFNHGGRVCFRPNISTTNVAMGS